MSENRQDKSKIVIKGEIDSWKSYAKAKNFDFCKFDGAVAFKSFLNSDVFNYAYVFDGSSKSILNKLQDYYGSIPFKVFNHCSNAKRENIFKESDYIFEETYVNMFIDLKSINDTALTKENNLEVKLVKNIKELVSWTDVLSKGFEMPKNEIDVFANNLFEITNQQFFLVYSDTTPISAGLSSICDEIAFIAYVATIPQKRRIGGCSMLINTALKEAKRNGCKFAALQASDMGKNVYQKAGFEVIDNDYIWKSPFYTSRAKHL